MELENKPKAILPSRVFKKDIRFHRGMFVAANVRIDDDGTPLFGKVNSELVEKMQRERLCQLCGRRIAKTDWCVFPGASELWKYQEAPLHIDCARYSALVCPRIWKVRWTFGFSVCKRYTHIECEPPDWNDPGCIPTWSRLSAWDGFLLNSAHDIYTDESGKLKCSTCNQENAGKMSYDEFMKWTEFLGYGKESGTDGR